MHIIYLVMHHGFSAFLFGGIVTVLVNECLVAGGRNLLK